MLLDSESKTCQPCPQLNIDQLQELLQILPEEGVVLQQGLQVGNHILTLLGHECPLTFPPIKQTKILSVNSFSNLIPIILQPLVHTLLWASCITKIHSSNFLYLELIEMVGTSQPNQSVTYFFMKNISCFKNIFLFSASYQASIKIYDKKLFLKNHYYWHFERFHYIIPLRHKLMV